MKKINYFIILLIFIILIWSPVYAFCNEFETINLKKGENFFSIPLNSEISLQDQNIIFQSCSIYTYLKDNYIPVSKLNENTPYFAKCSFPVKLDICLYYEDYDVNLFPGWNLITAPPMKMPSEFLFDLDIFTLENGKYISVKELTPGNAYWVYSNESLNIKIPKEEYRARPFERGECISRCLKIYEPGEYELCNDIVHYTYGLDAYCIEINSDNVSIDGKGHSLSSSTFGADMSIKIEEKNNVTIKNLEIKDFYIGIQVLNSSNIYFENNTIFNNSIGIFSENNIDITDKKSSILLNSIQGMFLASNTRLNLNETEICHNSNDVLIFASIYNFRNVKCDTSVPTDICPRPCSPLPPESPEFDCISECTVITESGYYTLCSDIIADLPSATLGTHIGGSYEYWLEGMYNPDTNTCIDIRADDVILEGLGHTIFLPETIPGFIVGIRSTKNNVTIKKCGINNFGAGVFLDSATNNVIENILISGEEKTIFGIYDKDGENNKYERNYISILLPEYDYPIANNRQGIRVLNGINTSIVQNRVRNFGEGINLVSSLNLFITDNEFFDNTKFDIKFDGILNNTYCDNVVWNNIGTGGKDILYFNSRDSFSRINNLNNVAQLILCNANDIILNNIILEGNPEIKNNAVTVLRTNNAVISNLTSNNKRIGLEIYNSNNNTIIQSNFNNNTWIGIYILRSFENSFYNNLICENNIDVSITGFGGHIWEDNTCEIISSSEDSLIELICANSCSLPEEPEISCDPFKITLKKGWNYISLPIDPINSLTSQVFPGNLGVWSFNPSTNTWENALRIKGGKGYIILISSERTYTISGISVDTIESPIGLIESSGWNLIGTGCYNKNALTDFLEGDSVLSNYFYCFDEITGSFYESSIIPLGKSCFVLIN